MVIYFTLDLSNLYFNFPLSLVFDITSYNLVLLLQI